MIDGGHTRFRSMIDLIIVSISFCCHRHREEIARKLQRHASVRAWAVVWVASLVFVGCCSLFQDSRPATAAWLVRNVWWITMWSAYAALRLTPTVLLTLETARLLFLLVHG